MTRKRVLEIILAVVCVLFIPLALINYARGKLEAANAPRPPARDPKFVAALQAGISLEQQQQYEAAINKYMEAELFASKMSQGKNDAFREVVEHIVNCASASGDTERANSARKQIIRLIIGSGIENRDAGHLEEAVAKFQDAEQRATSLDAPDAHLIQDARVPLAAALWKLGRSADTEAVFARMISDVSQPLNDFSSVLGLKCMEIAMIQSELGDWSGVETSSRRAIEEFEKTMSYYGESQTASLAQEKLLAMNWLEVAYAREKKYDLALSAADQAYDYSMKANGPVELKRQIAELAISAAQTSQQKSLETQWQERLNALPVPPTNPCQGPAVKVTNCMNYLKSSNSSHAK
jgi:hypothetical protein